MAQLLELRAEGASAQALATALEREGLPPAVAVAVAAPAFAALLVDPPPDSTAQFGVDLAEIRRLLRVAMPEGPAALLAPNPALGQISAALQRAGVAHAAAIEAAQTLGGQVQAEHAMKLQRLRRLGLQAMTCGVLFAAFFTYAGAQPQPGSRWHWMTAAMSAGIGLYGAAVFRRAQRG